MKKCVLLLSFNLLCFIYSHAQWVHLPISVYNQFTDQVTALCADDSGNIYAGTAYAEVYKWNGAVWTQLTALNTGSVYGTGIRTMVTDRSGNLYVAGDASIDVAEWDGTQWTILGNYSLGSQSISSVAIDTAGNIYAGGYSSSNQNFVVQWNGTRWIYLDQGSLGYSLGGISSIAVGTNGYVYVTGQSAGTGNDAYIEEWDGTVWNTIDDTLVGAAGLVNTQVLLNSTGDLFWSGTYIHSGSNTEDSCFLLKQHNGVWQRLNGGTGAVIGGTMGQLAVDTFGNVYTTVFDEIYPSAYALRWDGMTVSKVGNNIDTSTGGAITFVSGWPSLVLSKNFLYTTSLSASDHSNLTSLGQNYFVAEDKLPCVNTIQPICFVSVDTNTNKNVVYWDKVNKYAIDSYYIYRDTVLMAAIDRDSLSEWEDTSSLPNEYSYKYTITTRDTCGIMDYMSPYHQSLSLSPIWGYDSLTYRPYYAGVRWTPYQIENDTSPIGLYQIYIDSISNGNWQLLASVADSPSYYYDTGFASLPYARYRLVIQTANPCNPTRSAGQIYSNTIISDFSTGITELNRLDKIQVYPNPTTGFLNINNYGIAGSDQKATANISNALGQNMFKEAFNLNSGITRIDMTEWAMGVYCLAIKINDESRVIKIVKQ